MASSTRSCQQRDLRAHFRQAGEGAAAEDKAGGDVAEAGGAPSRHRSTGAACRCRVRRCLPGGGVPG